MADKYVYPAIFRFHAGGVDIEFPDLPGCFSHGATQEEALDMAREAMGLHLYGMEEDGDPIPVTSPVTAVAVEENEAVVLVDAWMPPLRNAIEQRAVKKTLTLPKWLNDLAEHHQVNFSHLLQDALKQHLGIKDRP